MQRLVLLEAFDRKPELTDIATRHTEQLGLGVEPSVEIYAVHLDPPFVFTIGEQLVLATGSGRPHQPRHGLWIASLDQQPERIHRAAVMAFGLLEVVGDEGLQLLEAAEAAVDDVTAGPRLSGHVGDFDTATGAPTH